MITEQLKQIMLENLVSAGILSDDGNKIVWDSIEIAPVQRGDFMTLKITLMNGNVPVTTLESQQLKFGDTYTLRGINGAHNFDISTNV